MTPGVLDLLMSEEWPEAIPHFLICSDLEEDKNERAEGILDYIGQDLTDKNILDFGCGEGHLAFNAAKICNKSIGYDIKQSGILNWEEQQSTNSVLTTNFNKVIENGPYDLVIIYDVLDHTTNPTEVLVQVRSICHSKTKIFLRCHSWMSRHGSHLYKKINKAWINLFFTEEELNSIGLKQTEFIQKYYYPLKTQSEWIEKSGLKKISEDIICCQIEQFFKQQDLISRIDPEFNGVLPEWQMSQVFNDYMLEI